MSRTLNTFHVKRWTAVTWLGVALWAWSGFSRNYPPFEVYSVDPATGELSEAIRYKQLQDIPFAVGWPFRYVVPDGFTTPLPIQLSGAPAPRLAPSLVSPFAAAVNFALVLFAILALVYVLQTCLERFSLRTLSCVIFAFALYLAVGRFVATLWGGLAARCYMIAAYFWPVPLAIAVKYSLIPSAFRTSVWSRLAPRHAPFDDYDNPDDAIAAASKLDAIGDWDESMALYRRAGARWPEYADYIENCVESIAEKRSLANR